jgi:hypothetical protein
MWVIVRSESVAQHRRQKCERGISRCLFMTKYQQTSVKARMLGWVSRSQMGHMYSERGKATYMGKVPGLN